MPQLIAERHMTYANKALKAGDTFEAMEKDIKVLTLGKLARKVVQDDASGEARRSRRYQRRDMTAES